jgi:hypothetical protein
MRPKASGFGRCCDYTVMMTRAATLILALVPAVVSAEPTITLGPEVPFTAADLGDAVEMRGGSAAVIRVTRDGDELIVQADDRSQVVEIVDDNPHDAARIVAMVVVALGHDAAVAAPVAPAPALAPAPPSASGPSMSAGSPAIASTAPAPARQHSRFDLRGTVGLMRDDGGTYAPTYIAGIGFELVPSTRVVASVMGAEISGIGGVGGIMPLRLGLEGRAGALAVELGMMFDPETDCRDDRGVATGAYGAARVYVPLGRLDGKLTMEGGGYYARDVYAGCYNGDPVRYEVYAGYLGGGVVWPL